MKDIVPELLSEIQSKFSKHYDNSQEIQELVDLLDRKKATYKHANDYAIKLGQLLSDALLGTISASTLPDGRMYYNIGKRLLESTLGNNHRIITDYTKQVQAALNKKAGINLKIVTPELNQDRIDGLVNRLDSEPDFDKVKWMLGEPIVNFSQSIIDDSIKANSDNHYKAGLTPQIVRKASGHCCDWCQQIVGVYKYPDVPDDVWRRHNKCQCTVDYDPKNGKVRDVWSKTWRNNDLNKKIAERKEKVLNKPVIKMQKESKVTKPSYYSAKAIERMSEDRLRIVARNLSIKYHNSGQTGISSNYSAEQMTDMLLVGKTKSELVKDVKALQRRLKILGINAKG